MYVQQGRYSSFGGLRRICLSPLLSSPPCLEVMVMMITRKNSPRFLFCCTVFKHKVFSTLLLWLSQNPTRGGGGRKDEEEASEVKQNATFPSLLCPQRLRRTKDGGDRGRRERGKDASLYSPALSLSAFLVSFVVASRDNTKPEGFSQVFSLVLFEQKAAAI